MKPLPKFSRKQRWNQVDPNHLNNLVEEVEKLRNLTVGYGLNLEITDAGVSISFDPSVIPATDNPVKYVVLMEEPVEGAAFLLVREVKFRETHPPGVPLYDWASEIITAVPEFGFEPMDFKPFTWDAPEEKSVDDSPDLGTSFMKMQLDRRTGRQVVWFPGGKASEFKFAVVRDIETDTDFSVTVEAVRWDGTEWRILTGSASEIATYPGVHKKYYKPFIWRGSAVHILNTPLLRVFTVDNEMWLEQSVRWATRQSSGSLNFSDCTPVEVVTD